MQEVFRTCGSCTLEQGGESRSQGVDDAPVRDARGGVALVVMIGAWLAIGTAVAAAPCAFEQWPSGSPRLAPA